MKTLLWHEFCHLFGAVDLKEKGSIMDVQRQGCHFDTFTSEIICLNKQRSFNPHKFPLSPNKMKKAISLYQNREEMHQGEVGLNVFLAALYLEKRKSELALNECYKALKLNPNFKEIHNLCGIALRQSNNVDQAIKEYQKVKQSRHDFPETHFNLGILYYDCSRLEDSAYYLKKAIEINPDFGKAYQKLAQISFLQKKYSISWEYVQKAENCGIRAAPEFIGRLIVQLAK